MELSTVFSIFGLTIAGGVAFYVKTIAKDEARKAIKEHEKGCPLATQLQELNKKIDMVLETLLRRGE